FFASVKGLSTHEQVRHPSRFDGVRVLARNVLAETDKAAEENSDVPRLHRHAHFRPVSLTLRDVPSVLWIDEPGDERTDSIRQRFFNRPSGRLERASAPVRLWHGQCDDGGL